LVLKNAIILKMFFTTDKFIQKKSREVGEAGDRGRADGK
jgi:hypothetical protein